MTYGSKAFIYHIFVAVEFLLHFGEVVADEPYNIINTDNSFEFGYDNPDSFHHSKGSRNNVVQGEFGGRNPGTGAIDRISYTAGPRGYRPKGKNVVRNYDFSQSGRKAVGSKDDPYFDPNEDPSYNFEIKTKSYTRQEAANKLGDVSGKFSYLDDIGERHNVEFVAGKNTGFHVRTPFPDSNPRAYGPLFFKGRGKPIPRGRTSIQRQLDGSYRFVSAGPDQRRTETSDSTGHVRGSYTYLDDKGVQHTVHYIAGPETGYRVLKTVKGPHLPEIFPFGSPDYVPPNYYDYVDDVFNTAESGRLKSGKLEMKQTSEGAFPNDLGDKTASPSESDDEDFGDLFGGDSSKKKPSGDTNFPLDNQSDGILSQDDGSYKPSSDAEDDGSYKPTAEDGSYKPSEGEDSSYGASERGGDFSIGDYDDDSCCSAGTSGVNVRITGYRDGAIVTNLGENVLSVPPGVSVRAHVQAIDLIPLKPKIPSPSEQMRTETSDSRKGFDQMQAESKTDTNSVADDASKDNSSTTDTNSAVTKPSR